MMQLPDCSTLILDAEHEHAHVHVGTSLLEVNIVKSFWNNSSLFTSF